ncbi:gelsolin-like protein 2 [Acanthaster planci]|uniref:Gelsolin-like protein 2 n=1 Tax=Acanthaster planci TaxID=133434 RepID=A0A8B7YMP1_ACAPL|nr:gelsolin-like protein 2 [Acanthaster planci]XP_022092742.1 gelsolin-like protein 2 [Acanthaster planci]
MPGGLVKAKKYDWKDSNLALFGSDTEKKVKKESAETEPAWKGAGQQVGLQIWRINKFKVEHWPKEEYGKFFNGDSYIILNTYKEKDSEELNYDLHFWIGSKSTADEYGTAAYKTVELDTLLDDKPVQHREVEKHESSMFKGYFKSFTTMNGGVDSGFKTVKPEEYKPRLLKVSGVRKNVTVTEVPYCRSQVTEDDVYIIDKGNKLYLYCGSSCNMMEKHRGSEEVQKIKSTRGRASHEVVESLGHSCFLDFDETPVEEDEADDEPDGSEPSMFKLSDNSGQLEFTSVSNEGTLSRSNLSPDDVFILDTTKECFVWIGSGASVAETQNGMSYAHNYLNNTSHPLITVSIIKQGKETRAFMQATVA